MNTIKLITSCLAICSVTSCVTASYVKPRLYKSIVTDRQMLCVKYCAPTVAFKSVDGKLEDKIYTLSVYNIFEISKVYLLEDKSQSEFFDITGCLFLLLIPISIIIYLSGTI